MKSFIQYGAGNIGRGFIGAVLSEAGYHVVFADVNELVVNKINEDGKYTVAIMDTECTEQVITNISAVDSRSPELAKEIAQAQVVTTAVAPAAAPAPVVCQTTINTPAAEIEAPKGKAITSPMVGTFYAAPAPDAEPFVEVGKTIAEGDVVAYLETPNGIEEVKTNFAGKIVSQAASTANATLSGAGQENSSLTLQNFANL